MKKGTRMKPRWKALVILIGCVFVLGAHSNLMAAQKNAEDNKYALWNALATQAVSEAKALIGSPDCQDAVAL
jgi:hypothetical protein